MGVEPGSYICVMQIGDKQYIELEKFEELQQAYALLKHRLEQLERLLFGTKSERFVPDIPGQLALDLDAAKVEAEVQTQEVAAHRRTKVKPVKISPHGRAPLPASLRREKIMLEPQEDTAGMKRMGEEITEVLEYQAAELYVLQFVRPKYARVQTAEEERQGVSPIVIADLPARPIEKGIPGTALLTYLLISKFVDHLPLYRLGKMFERQGVKIADSTLADWIKAACNLLIPLYEALKREVLACDYLQMDETPIRVLESEVKGKSHRGYFWVCHAPAQKLPLFEYDARRSARLPDELLADFGGTLQSDGYVVYEKYEKQAGVTLAGCLAHSRREFEQALGNDQARAAHILTRIQSLYAVERQARERQLSADERLALRQELSRPVFDQLHQYLKAELLQVLPKSAIGQAIAYSLNRWEKLERFLLDGKIEIDNNLVENAIRPVALGRKNYLFAGNHEAARRIAIIYSFMACCKMNEVNPHTWLQDVLFRIQEHPVNRISELLPHRWKPLVQYPHWYKP
ncbi:MAG: IS66 family transposase [Saprospiraceae bacterium]